MKTWKTNGGSYTIGDILSEIREAESNDQNVCEIIWFLRVRAIHIDDVISKLQKAKEQGQITIPKLEITQHQPLSVFKDADIMEGWDTPKVDVTVTQSGKTIALKYMGEHKENHDLYYLLSWISEYDPKSGNPPCSVEPLYLFEPAENSTTRELIPKNE